ncbi:hypothetical protein K523DRAFT_157728 [Schizophyllum commune Tattone D]|nr:hypothetical protein K523DRAFT_157728 [Schizophyllum commune Tattone D]
MAPDAGVSPAPVAGMAPLCICCRLPAVYARAVHGRDREDFIHCLYLPTHTHIRTVRDEYVLMLSLSTYCHPPPIRQRIIAYAATLHYTFVILSRRGARAQGVVRRLMLLRRELRVLYVSSLAT